MASIKKALEAPKNINGERSSLPADRDKAVRQASTSLANHLRSSGQQTLNVNDLMKLALNKDGQTPGNVSDAASYMLANPKLFSQLESGDDSAGKADGIASAESFDRAANGAFDGKVPQGPTILVGNGGLFKHAMPDHEVKDVLNTFRAGTPDKQLDAQDLYELSQNPAHDAPPALTQAAKRALGDPRLLKELGLSEGQGAPRKTPEISATPMGQLNNAALSATALRA
ncbi:hypothetical protein M5C99_06175 [Acidovorax sp. NCPPB 2350]|nr:hypothetical protein M5C99_06175 [Acidovorax sp. NCPPB 2350]